MKDIREVVMFLITGLKTYKLPILAGLFILPTLATAPLQAQSPDPAIAIKELKEGYLLVRMPAYKAKIDTLKSLANRTDDPSKKASLEKQLQAVMDERDTLLSDYVSAFKNKYLFSRVAYFFDFDARDLNKATYYNLEGEKISVGDLSEQSLFYLLFERTQESKMDALVIYDRTLRLIPKPFPNNFTRGGINFLFLGISEKNFPAWRVGKLNKRLFQYWNEINPLAP